MYPIITAFEAHKWETYTVRLALLLVEKILYFVNADDKYFNFFPPSEAQAGGSCYSSCIPPLFGAVTRKRSFPGIKLTHTANCVCWNDWLLETQQGNKPHCYDGGEFDRCANCESKMLFIKANSLCSSCPCTTESLIILSFIALINIREPWCHQILFFFFSE